MLPPLFYVPRQAAGGMVVGDEIALPPDEAHHASKVLRLSSGAIVILVDGLGIGARCELLKVSPRSVTSKVHSITRELGEPAVRLTLAAGLSVGSKFDDVVQRGTELGVSRFVPLITEKSLVKFDDERRAKSRQARLGKVAVAAMKQCRRSYLPEVSAVTSMREYLAQFDPSDAGLIFHPGKPALRLSDIDLGAATKRITVLVGPESGFSEAEVELAIAAGFKPVSLGERILRTETAGSVVTALVMQKLNELG